MAPTTHLHAIDKATLPKPSFRLITDRPLNESYAHGDLSQTIRSYGYNQVEEDFERPEHYIRYIEPIEAELAKQVEYDMDEQDREWLEAINFERRKEGHDRISYELFEIIMDKLEKEWFDLIKRIPVPPSLLPQEDSKCSICDDGEGENSNAIVFCDGCNLAVHQDCYGVPYIPEGQWLCRKCTVSPENPVDCIFCPAEAGAFKQTTPRAQWAHLLCAIWIPEVGVSNTVYMEPVEGVEGVPKSRWKLICSICNIRQGACIQCDKSNCYTAFHVTCARREGLLGSMKGLGESGTLRAHCQKHLSPERRAELEEIARENGQVYQEIDPDREPSPLPLKRKQKRSRILLSAERSASPSPFQVAAPAAQSKAARAHAKTYTSGPPLVPAMIVGRIIEYVRKVTLRKKNGLVERICRYWSLKREARRGAPLLKRLHLEPWTASNASKQQTDAEKAKKLEYLVIVRNDLERVRMLAELVRKREKEKLKQAQLLQEFVQEMMFPHDPKLRLVLEKIIALDRQEMFLNPVSVKQVPDYLDIIKEPMSWSVIDEKLELHKYSRFADFERDIYLVLENAMTYNPPDNLFHKTAAKVKANVKPLLAELAAALAADQGDAEAAEVAVNDLEPSVAWLSALTEKDSEACADPLAELFAYKLNPPPELSPPPPPKPQKSSRPKPSAEEIEAKREARRLEAISNRRPTRSTLLIEEPKRVIPDPLPSRRKPSAPGVSHKKRPPRNAEAGPSRGRQHANKLSEKSREEPSEERSAVESTDDSVVVPLTRPQRGVVGLAAYSPLTHEERIRREQQLGLVVDKVDQKEMLKRFNVGWVLPPGMKRGGRQESDAQFAPINFKKGKARASHTPVPATMIEEPPHRSIRAASHPSSGSSLSALTDSPVGFGSPPRRAASEEQQTPTRRGKGQGRRGRLVVPQTEPMDIDEQVPIIERLTAKSDSPLSSLDGPQLNGPIIVDKPQVAIPGGSSTISTLSSLSARPARASNKRRTDDDVPIAPPSNKKLRLVNIEQSPTISSGSPAAAPKAVKSRKARPKPSKAPEAVRTDLVSPEPAESILVSPRRSEQSMSSIVENDPVRNERLASLQGRNNGSGIELPDDQFLHGTLVWAKTHGYCYFPAEVVDAADDYDLIADTVWLAMPASDERHWLVRFFDKTKSFAWVAESKIDLLGEDITNDAIYLSGKEPNNKAARGFKNPTMARLCRDAYREAQYQIAIPGMEVESE